MVSVKPLSLAIMLNVNTINGGIVDAKYLAVLYFFIRIKISTANMLNIPINRINVLPKFACSNFKLRIEKTTIKNTVILMLNALISVTAIDFSAVSVSFCFAKFNLIFSKNYTKLAI